MGVYQLVGVSGITLYRRLLNAAGVSLGYGTASVAFPAAPASVAALSPLPGVHATTWVLLSAGCFLLAWAINSALMLAAVRLVTTEAGLRDGFGGRPGWVSDLVELSLAVTVAAAVAVDSVALIFVPVPVVLCRRYLSSTKLAEQGRVDAQSGVLTFVQWHHEAEVEASRAAHR